MTLVEFLNTRYDETEADAANVHLWSCASSDWQPGRAACDCGQPDQIRRRVTAARGILRDAVSSRQWATDPHCPDLQRRTYQLRAGVLHDACKCLAVEFATHPDYRHEWDIT